MIRAGPGILKFFRSWSGPVLERGPNRSVRDQPVLVRGSLILSLPNELYFSRDLLIFMMPSQQMITRLNSLKIIKAL